uniref:EF-hand domain-containing protein n=1 Tax=Bos mutus grunniens TaxID=30521 RepID=A0A8C0AAT4_BOSMU
MWLESAQGPCLPPAQAEAAKFGPILSSCPYLAFQVIRLRHKGGCGPLETTRPLQRERMASRKAGTRGKAAATKQAQRGSSNVFSMFEQAQIQEFKEAFSCIDQNRDGIICKSDLRETYSQLGKVNVPEEELDAMLQEGKGPINFTVFLTLFGEKLNGTDPEEAILSAFRLFDPSGKGVVNKDEFRQLLLTQADKFSPAESPAYWRRCCICWNLEGEGPGVRGGVRALCAEVQGWSKCSP